MVAELIPLQGSGIPDARAFAMMESVSDSSLMLYGGVNENPINDAFIFDCNKRVWKLMYRADPSVCEPTGALATVHAGKLLTVSSTGGNRFDVVATLDPDLSDNFSFTSCMKNGVSKQLDKLEKFFNMTEGAFGMADDSEKLKESFDVLMKVMGALFDARTRKEAIDLELDCIHETLFMLNKAKIPTTANDKRLEEARLQWEAIANLTPEVREAVNPVQEARSEGIRKKIKDGTDNAAAYRKEFLESPIFKYETGFKGAYPLLDAARTKLVGLDESVKELTHLANMFEFPEAVEELTACVAECHEDLRNAKDVWDFSSLVEVQFTKVARKPLGRHQHRGDGRSDQGIPEGFQDAAKRRSATPIAKQGLDESVKNFLTSVPLVADLRSPDMRDRHWSSLMKVTRHGVHHRRELQPRQPASTGAAQIRRRGWAEIVDCANKEAKMEVSLKKLDQIWAKVEWVQIKHKDTDINTIKLGEEDFEGLRTTRSWSRA